MSQFIKQGGNHEPFSHSDVCWGNNRCSGLNVGVGYGTAWPVVPTERPAPPSASCWEEPNQSLCAGAYTAAVGLLAQSHGAGRTKISAESGEVVKRLDTRKEEIGAALYGRESGQALYLSSDWPLRDRHVVACRLEHRSSDRVHCLTRGNLGRLPKRSARIRIGGRDLRRSRMPQYRDRPHPRERLRAKPARMSLHDGSFCAAGYSRPCHVDSSGEYARPAGQRNPGDPSSRS